jgi:hypothetical protein
MQEIITVLWRGWRLPHCGGQARDPEQQGMLSRYEAQFRRGRVRESPLVAVRLLRQRCGNVRTVVKHGRRGSPKDESPSKLTRQ